LYPHSVFHASLIVLSGKMPQDIKSTHFDLNTAIKL
jgi:hypothetical protein